MPLNPMGVVDLSMVTDLLIGAIDDYWPGSTLWATLFSDAYFKPTVSGLTPDAVRAGSGCQVTVTLIHIEPHMPQRNFASPPQAPSPNPPPPRGQNIPAQPLALDLQYFVTAYSDNNCHQEQQAMSIILDCFYQNPVIRKTVVYPGSPAASTQVEFTLTMEIETVDSVSQLWRAFTAPFRLSTLYRVGVVFLTPPA